MSTAPKSVSKPVREINKNFKYYKWSDKPCISINKKQPVTDVPVINNSTGNSTGTSTGTGNSTGTSTSNMLSLGKTYKYNLNMSFIKLYYNNERAVFQTPMLFVPYAPRRGEFGGGGNTNGVGDTGNATGFKESYYLTASLFNDEYDTEVSEFESWVADLEVQTLKLLRKRPYLNATAAGKTPLLKFDDYRGCQKLNLKFERANAKFYIIEGKSRLSRAIPFQEIATPCYAVFIIELGGVWIKKHAIDGADAETEWGINFILHGAQCTPSHTEPSPLGVQPTDFIYNPGMMDVVNKFAVSQQPPPPPPPLPQLNQINPVLVTYLKMLKLGIPRDAVKHKMMLAGDDPALLDSPHGITQGLPPPPPPPIFNLGFQLSTQPIASSASGPPKITSDMLATVRLKKADTDSNTVGQQSHKKHEPQQQGFKVNLSDILAIRSRLKPRVVIDDAKDSYSKIFKK